MQLERPDIAQRLFYAYPQITPMPKLAIPTASSQHGLIRFTYSKPYLTRMNF
jgi:hypothetical protein